MAAAVPCAVAPAAPHQQRPSRSPSRAPPITHRALAPSLIARCVRRSRRPTVILAPTACCWHGTTYKLDPWSRRGPQCATGDLDVYRPTDDHERGQPAGNHRRPADRPRDRRARSPFGREADHPRRRDNPRRPERMRLRHCRGKPPLTVTDSKIFANRAWDTGVEAASTSPATRTSPVTRSAVHGNSAGLAGGGVRRIPRRRPGS